MSNKKYIKDYLHYYLKSDLLCRVKRKNDIEYHVGKLCEVTYKSNHGDWASFWFDDVITVTSQTWETSSANNHFFFFGEDSIVPLLRPLSSMTDNEAIKLCSIYSPEAFGDYRFSKWIAVKDEANFCYNVTNPKSDMSFDVDIEEMHIKVYEDGSDTYPSIENHTYFTEYLKMGFDIFGLIDAGLAIDKTEID